MGRIGVYLSGDVYDYIHPGFVDLDQVAVLRRADDAREQARVAMVVSG